MTWNESIEQMKQGNIIHLAKGINYVFLFKPNHLMIFTPKDKEFYHIKPAKWMMDKINWEVDNFYKEEINKLLTKD